MEKTVYSFSLVFLLLLSGCRFGYKNEKEFYKWLNDPENGLVKNKDLEGLKLTVKYLPPEYLTFNELRRKDSYTPTEKDSIFNSYKNSYAFLLNISSNEDNKKLDVMMKGVTNMEEYKGRVQQLNFEMNDYLTLKTETGEFKPVLSNLENIYGLKNSRTIYVVFAGEENGKSLDKAKKLDFVFNDEVFGSGIHHFVFYQKNLKNIPQVNWN